MTVINREQTTFEKCESPADLLDKLKDGSGRGVMLQQGLAPATIVLAPDAGETIVVDPKLGTVLQFAFSLAEADIKSTTNGIKIELPNGGTVVLKNMTLLEAAPVVGTAAGTSEPQLCFKSTGQAVQIVDRTGSGFRDVQQPQSSMVLSTLIAHGVLDATSLNYLVVDPDVTYREVQDRPGAENSNGIIAGDDALTLSEDGAISGGNVLVNDSSPSGSLTVIRVNGADSNVGARVASDHGWLTLNPDGSYSYEVDNTDPDVQGLAVGESFTEIFSYTVSDGNGGTRTAAITITITGTNDGPVANADAATIAEDAVAPVTGNVLSNDTDVDGDMLTVTTTGPQAGGYGTLTLNADGSYSYALDSSNPAIQALGVGESLTETFSYSISDGNGGTSSATITITITGTNDGPVANADVATIAEEAIAPVTGNVLTNDTDIDGDALAVTTTGLQAGSYGSLTLNGDGSYSYSLDNANPAVQALGAGETLTETFTYFISDGQGGGANSTLTITITGANDGPVANPDVATAAEDDAAPITGNLLTNDTDLDGDALAVTSTGAQAGTYGTVTINADGTFSYVLDNANPAVQALGVGDTVTETFSYSISDGNGGTSTSTLTIFISGANDGPVANADTATIAEDAIAPVTGSLLTNDTDAEGDTLSVTNSGTQPGSHGTLTLNGDGSYSYSLDNSDPAVQGLAVGEILTETFTYIVSDGNGGTATSTLTITITGTNDDPVANADAGTIAEDTIAPVTGNVLTNDTDVDGNALAVTTTGAQAGSYGSVTINADGSYSYALDSANPAVQALGVGETLTETFNYSISDGNGGTATSTLTITITGTNDGPVANADAATIAEDAAAPVTGNLLGNDTDADGDALTVTTTGAQTGSYGTISIFGDGSYSYALDNGNATVQALGVGETLTETFNYSISDGNGGTSTSTLTITITGTNDNPVADDDSYGVTEDGSITINAASGVLNGDTDIDGDTLTVTAVVGGPSNGTLVMNADGSFTYTPVPGFNGTDSFTYEVSDGNGGTDTATVTINVGGVNDDPVANPDTSTVAEDTVAPVTGNVLTNDADVDGDALAVTTTGTQAGSYGAVTIAANGAYSYALNNANPAVQALGVGETLTETFNYSISDGNGGTATSTLTITITGT
ncbi:MAG: Ig-like domain-containing protein, partial [Dongiaceae bacterium]